MSNSRKNTGVVTTAQMSDLLNGVAFWSTTLPILSGIVNIRKLKRGIKFVALLALVSLITDILTDAVRGSNVASMYIPRVFTVVEFTLISAFFISEIDRRLPRLIIVLVNLLFIGVAVFDWTLNGVMQMDDLSLGIESITFLIYSILLLYFIMKDMAYPSLLSSAQFWIISGILIYFGGCIFVFVSSNYLVSESMELFDRIWVIHSGISIIYNVLITVGLWKVRKQYQ